MGSLGTADKVVGEEVVTWSMTQPPGNSAANGTPSLVLTASMMVYFAFFHMKTDLYDPRRVALSPPRSLPTLSMHRKQNHQMEGNHHQCRSLGCHSMTEERLSLLQAATKHLDYTT
jgi:hypothetical protein